MTIDGNLTSATATASNVASMFLDRVQTSADKEAFRYLVAGEWVSATWRQTADRVDALAAGLLALGIETEQRVGIASSTRYEWILADLAIMCSGAATTTVYPSTNAGDTAYILADSECRIVFAEDTGQLAKLIERRRRAAQPHQGGAVRRPRRRRLGDHPGRPRRARPTKYLLEHPSGCADTNRCDHPGAVGDVDLHLGNHRTSQGSAVAAFGLGCTRGTRVAGLQIPRRGRSAVDVAADGARVRQGPDRPPSSRAGSPPRSTAASTRSSTTWRSSNRRSWVPHPGSSRRRTPASSPPAS